MGWLIFVIVASIAITIAVLMPNIIEWLKPSHPPDEQPANAESPTPVPAVVEKRPQYLGNSNTKEIHDLANTTPSCQIEKMNEENKVLFASLEEVEKAIKSGGYNGCRWCLSEYHTD